MTELTPQRIKKVLVFVRKSERIHLASVKMVELCKFILDFYR
jgi:hypothetical protein